MAKRAPASPELGNSILLDHVNLRIGDQQSATLFYLEGLGLTRDPYRMTGTGNMWVNIGQQQIHLPTTNPTPFPGEIGLVLPNLDAVRDRLKRVAPRLAHTNFDWRESRGGLVAHDPWGRRLRLHAAGSLPALMPLALAYVKIWAPPGSVAAIGAFYEQVLGAPCHMGGSKMAPRLSVTVGAHQTLRFVERAGPTTAQAHNNHLALYLTRYRETYANMQALRIVMEKDRHEQFRFDRIVQMKSGTILLELEHEIRSLYHGDYGRPLVNRGRVGGKTGHVIGRDT